MVTYTLLWPFLYPDNQKMGPLLLMLSSDISCGNSMASKRYNYTTSYESVPFLYHPCMQCFAWPTKAVRVGRLSWCDIVDIVNMLYFH